MLLTSTFGTTSRFDIFALSSIRLFQSSMSMYLLGKKNTAETKTFLECWLVVILFLLSVTS